MTDTLSDGYTIEMPQPVDEAELTATERGWRLALMFLTERGKRGFTTREIAERLGYGSYSAAASLLDRSRLTGLWRDDDGRWKLMLDWPW